MELTAAVQEQIRRFVVGHVSADDLSDWLSVHAQEILDSGLKAPRRLMDLAFSLIEDEIQGHRSVDELRAILASEVPSSVQIAGSYDAALTGSFQLGTMSFTTLQHAEGAPSSGSTSTGFSPLKEPFRHLLPTA